MRLQTRSCSSPDFSTNETARVQVTGLYEDIEAGIRAKALMECVQSGLELPVRFKLDFWRFDWLREQSLRDIALSSAKDSALIIVSATRTRPLPPQMEKWVAAWSRDKQEHPSALVVLLPGGQNGQCRCSGLHDRLRRAAEKKHADFFYEFYESSVSRTNIHHNGQEQTILLDNQASSRFMAAFGQPFDRMRFPQLNGQARDSAGQWR
jgi:hypothetical protein